MKTIFGNIRMATAAVATSGLMAMALVASQPAAAKDLQSWYQEIGQTIADNQRYPRSALSRNIQGVAKVRLTITRDGTITNYEVVEETGERVLDNEIPKLMERIAAMPTPPSDISDDKLTFVVPLAWRLQ